MRFAITGRILALRSLGGGVVGWTAAGEPGSTVRGLFRLSAIDAAVRAYIALMPVMGIDPCDVVLVTRTDDSNPLLGSRGDIVRTLFATASRREDNELPVS